MMLWMEVMKETPKIFYQKIEADMTAGA